MIITNMTAQHVSQVAELEKLCFSDPWSEKSVASELNNSLSCWLVAEENGVVTGYVGSQTVIDESDMMNVAVHPDCRRRGIGRALIERLVAELKKTPVKFLMLEVRASNDAAIHLYEHLGFVQVGCRRNYYRNPKEDALILRKEWQD